MKKIMYLSVIFVIFLHTSVVAKTPDQIMRANCSTCHGEFGEGGTSWIDPSQRAFKIAGRSITSIKKWARDGRPPEMPAFHPNEISDIELDALAVYINALPESYIPPPVADVTVTITDETPWYNDMQIQVSVGDTVRFVNQGNTYHPVTQIEYVATEGVVGTDSGLLGPQGEYYRQFNDPGVYTFLCKVHPYMRGQVYVDETPVPPTHTLNTPLAIPQDAGVGEIWVEAQFQNYPGKAKDGVIQVIDAATWQVTDMIPVGNNPHNIWFKKGGDTAVITNWFDNYLTEIDANTKTPIANHIAGAAPAHIISDFAGDNFYVSIEGSYYIQSFSQSNMRMNAKPAYVSGNGPHGIWYGGGKLMTANSLDNTVTFLDAATLNEIITLPAGLYPLGAGLNSTGTKGYAGNCLSGDVSVYDLSANVPVKTKDLFIDGCPVQAPVSPDDLYVVVPNSPTTTVIDTATDNIVAQFPTGKGAHGAAYVPKADGSGWFAVVTHKTENYVSVIDLTIMQHVGDIELQTTTTGNITLFGVVDTGGNGIAARPLPAPWQ